VAKAGSMGILRRVTAATIQAVGYVAILPRPMFVSAVLARRLRLGTRAEGGVLDAAALATVGGLTVAYKVAGRYASSVLPPGSEQLMGIEQAAAARLWAWACGADGSVTELDLWSVPETWFEAANAALGE